ncbi:unnamed protein product [Spirodela intermedia]|uniref:ZF-HD dimerization-type domain-containing protein n=1 Tax=Spirodela intermedia TaxID=51605 RepID=A0A7I8KT21_SPIIN|nr:unnamed protein product [Spirodela intermedia]
MDFDDHDNPEQIGGGGADSSAAAVAGTSGSWRAATGAGSGGGGGGVRYRECLKNHAVNIGGHAVDGCGEFMPAGEEGTMDALKCAACNCHRNFHRKEIEGQQLSPYYRFPASGYLQMAAPGAAVQMRPLALPSTSGRGGTHSRDQDDMSTPMVSGGGGGGGSTSSGGREGKKRFRTKFTQEQKEKMLAFAEKVGWRIQKHDEAAVQQFCTEAAVKRHVLKVWMHNNKHTLGTKPSSAEP